MRYFRTKECFLAAPYYNKWIIFKKNISGGVRWPVRAPFVVLAKKSHTIPRNLFRERNVITRYWPVGLVSSSRTRRFASSKFKGNKFSRSISIITCASQRTFFGFFRAVPWPLEELDTFWTSSYLHPTRWCFSYFFVWPWKRNLLSYFRSNFHHEKVDLSHATLREDLFASLHRLFMPRFHSRVGLNAL